MTITTGQSNSISADNVSSIIICAELCRQSKSTSDNEIRIKTLSELIELDESWVSPIIGYIVSLSFIDFQYFLNSSMIEKQRFFSYLRGKDIVEIRNNHCNDCMYANDCNLDRGIGCGITLVIKGESND